MRDGEQAENVSRETFSDETFSNATVADETVSDEIVSVETVGYANNQRVQQSGQAPNTAKMQIAHHYHTTADVESAIALWRRQHALQALAYLHRLVVDERATPAARRNAAKFIVQNEREERKLAGEPDGRRSEELTADQIRARIDELEQAAAAMAKPVSAPSDAPKDSQVSDLL